MNLVSIVLSASILVSAAIHASELVPNDLSQLFKSVGKMPERKLNFADVSVTAKVDPIYLRPILIQDVPRRLVSAQWLAEFIRTELGKDYNLQPESSDPNTVSYSLRFKEKCIDSAWVITHCQDQQDKCDVAFKIPKLKEFPIRFAKIESQIASGIALVGHRTTEYSSLHIGTGKTLVTFPLETELRPKSVIRLSVENKSTAKTESFRVAQGSFPDCIRVDSQDRVWFTQPLNNLLSRFYPEKNEWFHKTVGSLPDGLWMDRKGRLWFGEYGGQAIGLYDPVNDNYQAFKTIYSPSNPAIPFEDRDGVIWTTDHQQNRIIKLDPAHSTQESFLLTQAKVWPVELTQNDSSDDIFITETYANRIGRLKRDLSNYGFLDLSTSGNPAFFEPDGKSLWISLWSAGAFMKLNTETGEQIEYQIKDTSKPCSGLGPISFALNGGVYIGCRMNDRVYRFDQSTGKLDWASGVGVLKDGSAVDSKDRFWITNMAYEISRVTF